MVALGVVAAVVVAAVVVAIVGVVFMALVIVAGIVVAGVVLAAVIKNGIRVQVMADADINFSQCGMKSTLVSKASLILLLNFMKGLFFLQMFREQRKEIFFSFY